MNKNRIFFTHGVKAFLFILLTISFLVPSGATAAVNTVSPDNVTINMFDYWLTEQATADDKLVGNNGALNGEINKKNENTYHVLIFGKNMRGVSNDFANQQPWNVNQDYVSRLVNPILSNGYPILLSSISVPESESLDYLFNPNERHAGKASYSNVGGLLQYGDYSNYGTCYYYDAKLNFASLDTTSTKFSLSETGLVTASSTSDQSDAMQIGQFFPFNSASEVSVSNINSENETINHYFGMTLAVDFHQPENGRINEQNMIFHFAGDDDVWVYIDDVLVAALGGLHATAGVDIDFSSGDITYRYIKETTTSDSTDTYYIEVQTLKDAFEYVNKATDTGFTGNTFADFSKHSLKFFYLERGNWDSNLELAFNLYEPLAPYGDVSISKTVDNPTEEDKNVPFSFDVGIEFNSNYIDLIDRAPTYSYQVVDSDNKELETGTATVTRDGEDSASAKITALTSSSNASSSYFNNNESKILLKHGQTLTLTGLPNGTKVTTTENDTRGYLFQSVCVVTGNGATSNTCTTSNTATVVLNNPSDSHQKYSIQYTNKSNPLGSLEITKYTVGSKTPDDAKIIVTSKDGTIVRTATYDQFKDRVYTFTDLPLGDYTVSEINAEVEGYSLSVKLEAEAVTVKADKTAKLSIKNTYTPDNPPPTDNPPPVETIGYTFKKIWRDGGAADRPTSITYTIVREGDPGYIDINNKASITDKNVRVDGDTWTWTKNLQPGWKYTTAEVNVPAGYVSECIVDGTTITLINTRVPETGDSTNLSLYGTLLALSAIGITILCIKKRRNE